MKRLKLVLYIILLFFIAQPVLAVPTFQTYIDGGTAGDLGSDEDSWFSSDNPLDLIVVGSYSAKTQSLTNVTLALSVLQGETGTITITGGDGATLLTTTTFLVEVGFNPNADADIDLLTNEPGNVGGYDGYTDKGFLPESENEHYPFKAVESDFLIYGLGSFDGDDPIHNYNADGVGSISEEGTGEEKTYSVIVTGFTMVHFDVYGFESVENKMGKIFKATWQIDAASHDSTYTQIPAPGAMVLGGIGVSLVGWLRRRRSI